MPVLRSRPIPGPERRGASVWRIRGLPDCVRAGAAAGQLRCFPSQIPGTLQPPLELGHRRSPYAPSPRVRLRAKLTRAQASVQGPIQPPARWPPRQPCSLRVTRRVRTGCAPPAAPQRPDHTHVQPSHRHGNHRKTTAGPLRPSAGWVSKTPGLRPSLPHPHKATGRCRPLRTVLTLFGAPAGRSVFSLPAGPDANVEKDGSSASLTAMSDSPGGCLRAGRGRGRSQGATLDRRSGASHRTSPPPTPRPTLHLPH